MSIPNGQCQNVIPPAEIYNAQLQAKRNQSEVSLRRQEKYNQPQPRFNHSGSPNMNHSRDGKDFVTSSPNNNRVARSFQQVPRKPLRQPATPQGKPTDETDNIPVATKPVAGNKPIQATAEAAKTVDTTKAEATKPVDTSKAEATKPVDTSKAEVTKPEMPKSDPLKTVSLASVTPRKPLVPSSFILQKLQSGAKFAVNVVERATEAASNQTGFVCVTINEDVMDVYNQLCDEFSLQCEKEKEGYKPCIGETFSYFCKGDAGWYRARCLAPTRGALLDAGRVVSLEPSVCRKLPTAFASVPEFVAVIKMDGLQIGSDLTATVVSTSTLAVKVTVTDESGLALGEADAAKWATIVEYPQEPPRQPLRQPATPQGKPTDETDNIPVATKPVTANKPVQATKAEATKPEMPKSDPLKTVSLASVTPRKPLVPSSFILQKLQSGAIFAVNVVERATEAASNQTGFVCVTINEDVMDVYYQLCDEFSLQCEKEKEGYKPRIGETFSYFCKGDAGWYRARCLAPTRGALLDAGRVVSLEPSVCRKLPTAFASVPEFVAVIKMDGLQIGSNLTATVVSTSKLAVKVTLTDESGLALGEADAAKWATIVEYPQEPEEPQPDFSESPVEPKKVPEPVKKVQEPVKNIPEPVKKAQEAVKPIVKTVGPQAVAPKPVIRKPLVPDSYAVGNLKAGDMFLTQVGFFDEAEHGFVCVALHADSTEAYTRICEDFPLKCMEDGKQYTPAIGETFAFLNKEDEGWYRARCLSRTRACLLDMPLVISFDPSICRKLPSGYDDIPEFVAVIKSEKLEADSNVECTILSTSATETKIKISGIDGEYQVKRWSPPIEYPAESAPAFATAATPAIRTVATAVIPTLLRPCLEHNALYILCSVTSLAQACVRPTGSQELFDAALHATVNYGLTAKPLTEPAQRKQIVVAKFSEDGLCYRAFVKRVNVSKNRYLVEYVEYGNEEVLPLESLYPCPSKLSLEAMPPQASLVRLAEVDAPLTPPAAAYIDRLKDNDEHLILTIPGGEKSKASGCLVNLLVAKTCEPASQKITELCLHKLRYKDALSRFSPFSAKGGPMTLTLPYCDTNQLCNGSFAGYLKGDENASKIFKELSQKLQEYGERSGMTPYRPIKEELCIARNSKVNKWGRAVVIELDETGTEDPTLMFLDYGNLDEVPTDNILKMMPEFIEQYPITTRQFDILDFPVKTVTEQQIDRLKRFMKVTPDGRGELTVRAVQALHEDSFQVHAPELLQALTE